MPVVNPRVPVSLSEALPHIDAPTKVQRTYASDHPRDLKSSIEKGWMNVGFRPRLKARPSLYDLLRDRNIDRLSTVLPSTPTSQTQVVNLPPLPTSPQFPAASVPSTPTKEEKIRVVQEAAKMGPKKAAQEIDGEEQYGIYTPESILDVPS